MAKIHFSIAMSLCQSIRILQWVPTSIKDWFVLRCCNHCIWLTLIGNMQAAERFTAFCRDYREILFFPPEEVPIRFAPFQTWWNPVELCVCEFGGGDITELKAPFAKSPPPSPLPSLSSSSSCTTWWGYKVQRWVLEEGTQCQIFANPDKTLAPKVPRQHRRENFSPSFPFPDAFHSPKCPCL